MARCNSNLGAEKWRQEEPWSSVDANFIILVASGSVETLFQIIQIKECVRYDL